MFTKKAITVLSIFVILFASAWYVQTKIDRHHLLERPEMIMNNDPSAVDRSEYQTYGGQDSSTDLSDMLKPFAPREYIRIQDQWNSNP